MSSSSSSSSASAIGEILQKITSQKIDQFAATKKRIDAQYASIEAAADAAPTKAEEVRVLVDGMRKVAVAQSPAHPDAAALKKHAVPALVADPTARPDLAAFWATKLRHEMAQGRRRTELALLYGKVLSEHSSSVAQGDDASSTKDWDAVNHGEAHADAVASAAKYAEDLKATVTEFGERVFSPAPTPEGRDPAAFAAYLRDTVFAFEHADERKYFAELQKETTEFCRMLLKDTITADEIEATIGGLLAQDLLDERRRDALREVRKDAVVHAEIAAVLNMELTAIDSWSWPAEGVRVDFRRQINGKFRAFMDEDLMTALLLQWIGIKFSVHLRGIFKQIHSSRLWATKAQRTRATEAGVSVHSRPVSDSRGSIEAIRRDFVESQFMEVLPETFAHQAGQQYGDDSDDEDSDDDDEDAAKKEASTHIQRKQKLLHHLTADARVHRETRSESAPFVIVRTDFEWFGPSLPHGHMLAVLELFGVTPEWRDFVGRFLATPLLVPTGPEGALERRVRERGVPISHALSYLLAESMMFVLDFAVAREGGATFLRLHDDIWIWGSSAAGARRTWATCETFAKAAGLTFNAEKSGSVALAGGARGTDAHEVPEALETLPAGTIAWGFLKFDARAGDWAVDESAMAEHVAEMRARLATARSVLAWTNTYNKYMQFVVRNCGSAVHKDHPAMVMRALQGVHAKVFAETNGSAVAALALRISALSPSDDEALLLDGWVHWPLTAGGLELWNPFVQQSTVLAAYARGDDEVENEYSDVRSAAYVNAHLVETDRMQHAAALKAHTERFVVEYEKKHSVVVARKKQVSSADCGDVHGAAVEEDDESEHASATDTEDDTTTGNKIVPLSKVPIPEFPGFDKWVSSRRERSLRHWGNWYERLMAEATPAGAHEATAVVTGHLPALGASAGSAVASAELGGGALRSMTPYWSWIVNVYGESIIDALGSLVFMPADVVPRAMVDSVKKEKIAWE